MEAVNFHSEESSNELKQTNEEVNNLGDIDKLTDFKAHDFELKQLIINNLYKPVKTLHTELINFAVREKITLNDLNTTLIFALVRKFEFGYAVLTFSVGDCPINIIS